MRAAPPGRTNLLSHVEMRGQEKHKFAFLAAANYPAAAAAYRGQEQQWDRPRLAARLHI